MSIETAPFGTMPTGEPVRAAGSAFLPYYLENLAARLANTGSAVEAERLLQRAIELAPESARFRYNYGTFLRG